MHNFLDENKSVYKLKGLTSIYWINLDKDSHRRDYMQRQFDYWQIKNHKRVPGIDGRTSDIQQYLSGDKPKNMSDTEIACCLSHIRAIQEFYENTEEQFALILEDDVMLDTTNYWNFTWTDFISKLPHDWDCIQLCIISTGVIHVKLHPYFINDFSAAAYLISRHHAAKILKNHVRDKKYKLDNGVKPRAVSEDTILGSGKTYSIPLFLYRLDLGSAIHPEHIDKFHRGSHNVLMDFWRTKGQQMELDALMNYDPYLGRTTWKSIKPYKETSK